MLKGNFMILETDPQDVDGRPLSSIENEFLNRALQAAEKADEWAAKSCMAEAALCELIALEFAAMVCPSITPQLCTDFKYYKPHQDNQLLMFNKMP
jgi:hypothetical protein